MIVGCLLASDVTAKPRATANPREGCLEGKYMGGFISSYLGNQHQCLAFFAISFPWKWMEKPLFNNGVGRRGFQAAKFSSRRKKIEGAGLKNVVDVTWMAVDRREIQIRVAEYLSRGRAGSHLVSDDPSMPSFAAFQAVVSLRYHKR